jgi:hypothetical protein
MDLLKSYLETYCPSCKKKILSHARKCPYCHYDFTTPQHQQQIHWQKKIIRYWLAFCLFISIVSLFSSGIGIALATLLFSVIIGLFIIKQIIKASNFFK